MKENETKQSQELRKRLEDARLRFVTKHGEKKAKIILYGVPLALLTLLVLLALSLLLPIRSFAVTGDLSMFNESDIITAAELEEGDSLLWNTSGAIIRSIRKNIPLCDEIKVTKTLGGHVSIQVTFQEVAFYARTEHGVSCALDADLRVLDIDDSPAKYAASGAVKLLLPPIRKPVPGQTLVFYDTVEETDTEGETLYEVRKVSFYSYATDFLHAVEGSDLMAAAFGIDLTERFDIRVAYADKYLIRFGDSHDAEVKFRIFAGILVEGTLDYADLVSVDLSDPSRPTARPDLTIDFEPYR